MAVSSEIYFRRVTVGDKSVCIDCIRLENLPPMTEKQWIASGFKPQVADTLCKESGCRCILVPTTLTEKEQAELENLDLRIEGEKLIDEFIKKVEEGIKVDISQGYTIKLKKFADIKGIKTMPFDAIAQMESLITEWKILNNNKVLPNSWFDIADIKKMTDWLKNELLK